MRPTTPIEDYMKWNRRTLEREWKELENDPELANITPPEHLLPDILEKINAYETAKQKKETLETELSLLNEELTLVNKELEDFDKPFQELEEFIAKNMKRTKCKYAAAVLACLFVLSIGTVSIASPGFIRTFVSETIGSANANNIQVVDSSVEVPTYLTDYSEQEAYDVAKECVGLPIITLPCNSNFDYISLVVVPTLSEATLFYTNEEGSIISYQIISGSGVSVIAPDEVILSSNEYLINNTLVLLETVENSTYISFLYNNVYYGITGNLTAKNIEYILNELPDFLY